MMRLTRPWLAAGVVGLGLAFAALASGQPGTPTQDSNRVAAQEAILKLAANLDAKDVAERARSIVKTHDSEDISSVFRVKSKGGLGIGKLTEVGPTADGIDRLVQKLGYRKTITEAEIEKYSADYVRAAKVLQAMAELAPYRAPEAVRKNDQRAREWFDVAREFRERTGNFRQAVDERDPKKLRLAAYKLQETCCTCHNLLE
jgi:hypothetical protein